MMAPEATITASHIEEIVGDLPIVCDYNDRQFHKVGDARWQMRLACNCGHSALRLACDGCKDYWLAADGAAECPKCSEVTAPARHLFWYVVRIP